MGFWDALKKVLDALDTNDDEDIEEEAKKGYGFWGSNPDDAKEDIERDHGGKGGLQKWLDSFDKEDEGKDKRDNDGGFWSGGMKW